MNQYQRQGIGKHLIKIIVDKYADVRQICLMTDNSDKTRKFYESLGLISYDKVQTIGYMVKK